MKKGFFASLLLSLSMILSSCTNSSLFMSDSQIINAQFNKVLEALEKGDKATLKSLFSKNAIEQAENFDASVEALFVYFQGTNPSYVDDSCVMTEKTQEYGLIRKEIWQSYDVTTSHETYRFMLNLVTDDDFSAQNVGIWSLYIVKMKDDSDQSSAYWGDGKDTPGINIGILSPE